MALVMRVRVRLIDNENNHSPRGSPWLVNRRCLPLHKSTEVCTFSYQTQTGYLLLFHGKHPTKLVRRMISVQKFPEEFPRKEKDLLAAQCFFQQK